MERRTVSKDLFSGHARDYVTFRPGYPGAVFDDLCSLIPRDARAWDVGTGNGQVAWELAQRGITVLASDISRQQLAQARRHDRISYLVGRAESPGLADRSVDVVIAGQAIHWFDFDRFYAEVVRVLRPGGLVCALGYGLIRVNDRVDRIIDDYYSTVISDYWDPERRYIDEKYATIPFPFSELDVPEYSFREHWDYEHFVGYLRTWSAVKHYQRATGVDPVADLERKLRAIWPPGTSCEVVFPTLVRLGRAL